MYVPDGYRDIDADYVNPNLVSKWVKSEENREYLYDILVDEYLEYVNQPGNSILGKLDACLGLLIDKHEKLTFDLNCKSNTILMSEMNKRILREAIKLTPPNNVCISQDPAWTQKGPDFSQTRKDWSSHGSTGNPYTMEFGPMGTPQIPDRFARSKMYWFKESHNSRNFNYYEGRKK